MTIKTPSRIQEDVKKVKILLVSDIHGNYPALKAVAKDGHAGACDLVINTGDSTVYAPFANQTLEWLQKHRAVSILGNTDIKVRKLLKGKKFKKPSKPEKRIMYTSTADALTPANRNYLSGLKKKKILSLSGYTVGLYHGSPEDPDEFLFAQTEEPRFQELAVGTDCDIIVTGHSHSPYHRETEGVHFINPGSTGRMFDGDPRTSYAILTLKKKGITVEHYRCRYDVEAVVAELARQQLPPIYAEMYRTGRKLN